MKFRGVDYEKHGRDKNKICQNNDFIIFFFHEYYLKSKAAILNFAGVAGGEQVLPAPLGWYISVKN